MSKRNLFLTDLENKSLNQFDDTDVITHKFNISLMIIKKYVNFLYDNNSSLTDTKKATLLLANDLIEKYNFGSKFLNSVNEYVRLKYKPKAMKLKYDIQNECGVEDINLFDTLFNDIVNTSSIEQLDHQFLNYLK